MTMKTITVVLEVDTSDIGDIECDSDLQDIFNDRGLDFLEVTNFHEGDKLSEKPQHFSDRELAERGLPPFAWVDDGMGHVIKIERGMMGYFPCQHWTDAAANNDSNGVTPAQAEAMHMGSLVGWHVPGAWPSCHEKKGLT